MDGRVELEAIANEQLSSDELFEILRIQGIMQLGEVKRLHGNVGEVTKEPLGAGVDGVA